MSPLARFCLLAEMVPHLLGLQQRMLKAEGAAMVTVVDFEPPTWFRLCQLTYAESLSLLDILFGSGHTDPALRVLSTESESSAAQEAQKISPSVTACTLSFWLPWRNGHRALPRDVVEGISRPMWVFCPDDI